MRAEDDHLAVFISVCEQADVDALARVLRPDVTLTIDSGGALPVRGTVEGRHDVAAAIVELLALLPGRRLVRGHVNGRPGILVVSAKRVVGVIGAVRRGTRVEDVWIVVNPDKLRRWNAT